MILGTLSREHPEMSQTPDFQRRMTFARTAALEAGKADPRILSVGGPHGRSQARQLAGHDRRPAGRRIAARRDRTRISGRRHSGGRIRRATGNERVSLDSRSARRDEIVHSRRPLVRDPGGRGIRKAVRHWCVPFSCFGRDGLGGEGAGSLVAAGSRRSAAGESFERRRFCAVTLLFHDGSGVFPNRPAGCPGGSCSGGRHRPGLGRLLRPYPRRDRPGGSDGRPVDECLGRGGTPPNCRGGRGAISSTGTASQRPTQATGFL